MRIKLFTGCIDKTNACLIHCQKETIKFKSERIKLFKPGQIFVHDGRNVRMDICPDQD